MLAETIRQYYLTIPTIRARNGLFSDARNILSRKNEISIKKSIFSIII